jgi:hypothetical protein
MKLSFGNTSCSTDAKQFIKTRLHKVDEQTKLVFIEVEIKKKLYSGNVRCEKYAVITRSGMFTEIYKAPK